MPPSRALRILILIAAVLILLATMSLVPLEDVPAWGWDVSVFRAASRALMAGENPYQPENIPRFAAGSELATIPYYVYAPFFAVGFIPFALLPPDWTSRLWFLTNLALVMGSVGLVLGLRPASAKPHQLILGAMALAAFPPLRTLLILGQSSAVLLFLLAAAAYLIRRGRGPIAGLALSLAFFKPHLAFAPVFLALRRLGRPVLAFLAGTVLLNLPFLLWLDNWAAALVRTRAENLSYGCLPFSSLQALFACTLQGQTAWIGYGFMVVLTIIALVLSSRASAPDSAAFEMQLALTVVLGLMLLDNIRVADLILLLYPVLLLIREGRGLPRPARLVVYGSVLLAFAFPYSAQLWSRDPVVGALPIWYSIMSLSVFAGLAVALSSGGVRSIEAESTPDLSRRRQLTARPPGADRPT